jgi:ribonuclease T1
MRRKIVNPLIWAAVVVAAILAARWEKGREPAAPTQVERPAAPHAPSSSQTETRATPEPRSGGIEGLVPQAEERAQVLATIEIIERGGPFPYPKEDGTVFANREHRLPQQKRGYYREYTVPTPGARDRGARRVIRGQGGETWYTRDHYGTFVELTPALSR